MKGSPRSPLSLVLVLCVGLLAACQTPVGVRAVDPNRVERRMAADILSSGELSEQTRNILRWGALEEAYRRDPEATIARMDEAVVRGSLAGDEAAHRGFVALAELCFDQGRRRGETRYFAQSVVYAWAFLVPPDPELNPLPVDPRVQLAIRLYNRGLARTMSRAGLRELVPKPGRVELPRGSIDVHIDEDSRRIGNRILASFTLASELEVRGLRNRYRWNGMGVALAATVSDDPEQPSVGDRLYENLRLPTNALLVFEDFWAGIESRRFEATVRFYIGLDTDRAQLEDRDVPLAMEPTASFAYMLAESAPWARELKGFFRGDLGVGAGDGLASLQPYRPGRIPVVLVHGTASGPARWAELVNDLMADPVIRARYQFMLFTYNTGNPIAYSGWLLRTAIRDAIDAVDPEGLDEALHRVVVIGHSQGGLLAKLTAVDSGSRFWDPISDVPIEEMDLRPESRRILAGSLFVRPVPEVERVVFIATPHRGSYLAAWGPAQLIGRFTRAPANLMSAVGDLVTQDEVAAAVRHIDRVDGAVANMSPGNRFIQTLSELPIVEGVRSHSIIAVRGRGPLEDASDGVVTFRSAHREDVESELVIESGHSVQGHPKTSLEVRRILREHVGMPLEASSWLGSD